MILIYPFFRNMDFDQIQLLNYAIVIDESKHYAQFIGSIYIMAYTHKFQSTFYSIISLVCCVIVWPLQMGSKSSKGLRTAFSQVISLSSKIISFIKHQCLLTFKWHSKDYLTQPPTLFPKAYSIIYFNHIKFLRNHHLLWNSRIDFFFSIQKVLDLLLFCLTLTIKYKLLWATWKTVQGSV